MSNKYGFGKLVNYSFEEAITKLTLALQQEGFGILTEINVAETLKKKLDKDMPPYRILGACNPALAHRALNVEPSIGLLLPCNVIVRQDESGHVFVEMMDPNIMVDLVNNPAVTQVAAEVRERLLKAMNTL